MRAIDADALIAQMEADAEQMEDTIFKMATYAAINDVRHQPTAEAIPIEWIEEYSYDLDSEHETISACAIDDMLGAWRREQSDEAD